MSNAANKNGENSEPLSDTSLNSGDVKNVGSNAANVSSENSSSKGELPVSKPPHLIVVAPNALNAERMGPRLRAAREAKGWTLELASKETRIHKDYLGAIEDMMPNLLPGMPGSQSYLRGYLINYARSLGLSEPQEVVTRFLGECGLLAMEPTSEELAVSAKKTAQKQSRSWIVPVICAVVMTVIACAVAGALILKPWKKDNQTIINTSIIAQENSVYSNSAALTPASASDLSLHAVARGWIEVRGSDGTVYMSRELAKGDVYIPRIGAGWTITARDGGAFEWRLSGQSLGPLAEPGLPVYSIAVDEALGREPIVTNELID